jgi:3-hydroxyisobutyrate dehydrogenase-like beta-hydroxyacid dehydrogenase
MIEVLNVSSGRNSATQDKWPKAMLPRTFNLGFTNALMIKDVGLAVAEMTERGTPHDIMDAVLRAWQACVAEIGADQDFTNIIKPAEQRAGVVVKGGAK